MAGTASSDRTVLVSLSLRNIDIYRNRSDLGRYDLH